MESSFRIGLISQKFLILDIITFAFSYDDFVYWLWNLSKKSRQYLITNKDYIKNRKILKIKQISTVSVQDLEYVKNGYMFHDLYDIEIQNMQLVLHENNFIPILSKRARNLKLYVD